MTVWRTDRQATAILAPYDRVGQARVGPELGDWRDRHVYSIRTRATYLECLTAQAEYAKKNWRITLDRITPEQARKYLQARAQVVGDKRLSQERCALALMPQIRAVERELQTIRPAQDGPGELATISRGLERWEIARIMEHQHSPRIIKHRKHRDRNAFSTKVAASAGLRASELLTLQREDEREPSRRQEWDQARFKGYRDPVYYTVKGKGGLVRLVAFERELADRIEDRRYDDDKHVMVFDRKVPYITRYDIAGGNAWSKSFERASKAALDESLGAHSVRHTYAQDQMSIHMDHGHDFDKALTLTSQQLGHFRPEIALKYLR